jgi:putative acetyltransferase
MAVATTTLTRRGVRDGRFETMSNPHGSQVRHEQPGDEAGIRWVNDQAFGHSDESRIVDAARAAGHAVISLVAVEATTIVGHIMFTPVSIEPYRPALRALGLGPMAVMPDRQRKGIGSRLVEAGLEASGRLGYQVVVVIGHPTYYPRFGFRPARACGLQTEFDVPDDLFMVAELAPGVLAGASGVARYGPEFGDI